jgi:Ras GTPase-activating-like protein IQGAP2/3
MSVMLQAPSRASTSSSSSFIPVSRQNTMSSMDGARSVRQSKRYSVTALYLSMSAKEKDLEIEDDLARGRRQDCCPLAARPELAR